MSFRESRDAVENSSDVLTLEAVTTSENLAMYLKGKAII